MEPKTHMPRRNFLQTSAVAGTLLFAGAQSSKGSEMNTGTGRNHVVRITWKTDIDYKDPYSDIEFGVRITGPDNLQIQHPGFWAGDNLWQVRIALPQTGEYSFETICSNPNDKRLHGQQSQISVNEYKGQNPFFQHGRIQIAEDKRHFEHKDGTPFFWLGDTWWMGLCSRLDYPSGFKTLVKDRVEKGFNVIQIVAGPYPDMEERDPRGKNPAGYPFISEFRSINPEYYDDADKKIWGLVEAGLMPCIVGMWGYYLPRIGLEGVKRFWRYLVARYGAYPVAWCIAGEATMPFYLSKTKTEDSQIQKEGWTEVTRYVKEIDGFKNPITIHPTHWGREMVDDPALLDFEMLQTGHSDLDSIPNNANSVIQSVQKEPHMPAIVAEVNYEGILGRCWQNIQRLNFYSSVLNGAAGHTYGANGIWQMSTIEKPYGKSPHGRSWGNTPWQDAYQLPGSFQTGLGGGFMRRFPWWKLERHPEWVQPECDPSKPYSCTAAGIPGKLRIIYSPLMWDPPKICALEKDCSYRAYFFDPLNGIDVPIGKVNPNQDGEWRPPEHPGEVHDWLVVVEAES